MIDLWGVRVFLVRSMEVCWQPVELNYYLQRFVFFIVIHDDEKGYVLLKLNSLS
jgi:hypothetical protein